MSLFKHPSIFLKPISLIVLPLLFVSGVVLYGDSIRFKNKVVDTGMSKGKVFMITGQPDWKASYLIGELNASNTSVFPVNGSFNSNRVSAFGGFYESFGTLAVEEWLFNQGKRRLMQLLRFEDERLVAIKSLGYGFDDSQNRSFINPDWTTLKRGDTSYEVLNRFGEPSISESRPDINYVRIYGPSRLPLHYRSAEVSWWYYNAGPNRLFRIVKFVNGRVVEISTEGYGLLEK